MQIHTNLLLPRNNQRTYKKVSDRPACGAHNCEADEQIFWSPIASV